MELLQTTWNFIWTALVSLYTLLEATGLFVWDFLVTFHVNHPRLEGLVIGVTLAWLMMRRDRHPLIRALSAPLKLIIDIMDLVWDHCCTFLSDVWEWIHTQWRKVKDTVSNCLGWCRDKVVGAWSMCMGGLRSIRNSLKKEKTNENQKDDA